MRAFIRQLRPALVAIAVFTVVLGVVYPLVVTAVGQAVFSDRANGSLVRRDGEVVGSELIGQPFAAPGYFHPRPSAGDGDDATVSGGSNLGPSNPELLDAVAARTVAYRLENGLTDSTPVPVDAVTASASGLDPHISPANARLQAGRVAAARGVPVDTVLSLIDEHTDGRSLGVLGEAGVNVLLLNLALDELPG